VAAFTQRRRAWHNRDAVDRAVWLGRASVRKPRAGGDRPTRRRRIRRDRRTSPDPVRARRPGDATTGWQRINGHHATGRDATSVEDADPDTATLALPTGDANAGTNRRTDADTDRVPDPDAVTNPPTHGRTNAGADADARTEPGADADTDVGTDGRAHPHARADPVTRRTTEPAAFG
jgi:hypothetical protein